MSVNETPTPDHPRTMDVSWAHFFRLFPTLMMELANPDKKIKAITELNSIFKAIETSTDSAWLMEIDGEERIVLYEEMTSWDSSILADLHFRKILWWREHNIPPIGLIIVPVSREIKRDIGIHEIRGSEKSVLSDQNEILVLPQSDFITFKERHGQDVSLEMLSIFAKDESIEVAAQRIERLIELPGDMEIKRTAQFIAFCWAQYRFGDSEILDNLWKRINSMIETLDVYKDIVNKGEVRGEARGIAKSIISNLQKVFKMIIPNDIKDKIYAQTNIDVLNKWLELTLEVPDFESFREQTGL
jgi:hypothetical protein